MKKSRRLARVILLLLAVMLLIIVFCFIIPISTSILNNKANNIEDRMDKLLNRCNEQYDIVVGNTYEVLDIRELECGYMNPIYRLCIVVKDTNSDNRTYYKYEVNHIDNNYISKAIVAPGDKIKFTDKDTFEIVE